MALVAEAQIDAASGPCGRKTSRAGSSSRRSRDRGLLEARHHDTLKVRRSVTSPGGSTARGLAALEHGGLRCAFDDAMQAVLVR